MVLVVKKEHIRPWSSLRKTEKKGKKKLSTHQLNTEQKWKPQPTANFWHVHKNRRVVSWAGADLPRNFKIPSM